MESEWGTGLDHAVLSLGVISTKYGGSQAIETLHLRGRYAHKTFTVDATNGGSKGQLHGSYWRWSHRR